MHDIIDQLEAKRGAARLGGGARRIDAHLTAAELADHELPR